MMLADFPTVWTRFDQGGPPPNSEFVWCNLTGDGGTARRRKDGTYWTPYKDLNKVLALQPDKFAWSFAPFSEPIYIVKADNE